MMKRTLLYISALLTIIGCSESEYNGTRTPSLNRRYLAVDQTNLVFPATETSKAISIESMDTKWQLSNSIDWIGFSSTSGNTSTSVNISVKENKSIDKTRIGVFYLTSEMTDWNYNTPISVTQSTQKPYIELSETVLNFSGNSSSKNVYVNSNCNWYCECSSSWFTIEKKENTIVVSVSNNETNTDRTGVITIKYTGSIDISQNIILHQTVANVHSTTNQLDFEYLASSLDFSFTSEVPWTISTSNSWIDVSSMKGESGTYTLKAFVSPNISEQDRSGHIYINIGSAKVIQIPVHQGGILFRLDKEELSFTSENSSSTINILSNSEWLIKDISDWLSISETKGEESKIIKITSHDNPSTTSRTGYFYITSAKLQKTIRVKASQEGKYFGIKETNLTFDDKASNQELSINTNGIWSASSNNDWITVTPYSMNGSGKLNVSVEENTNAYERTGSITITMSNESKNVYVTQKGKFITISNDALNISSKGGKLSVFVSSNDSWSTNISGSATWIKATPSTGNGNIIVDIIVSDNPSNSSRMAEVQFWTKHNQQISLQISQDARFFSVDTKEINFFAKGGTSELITISTDSKYKIETSSTWLTTNQFNDTFTVTASENNESVPRNGEIKIVQTDLNEQSDPIIITVIQKCKLGNFDKIDFDNDENWN